MEEIGEQNEESGRSEEIEETGQTEEIEGG